MTLINAVIGGIVGFILGIAISTAFNFRSVDRTRLGWRNWFTVTLPLAFAFYLMISAIVATQVFDKTYTDPGVPRKRLETNLNELGDPSGGPPSSLRQFSRADDMDLAIPNGITDRQLAAYMSRISNQILNFKNILKDQPDSFGQRVKDEIKFILERYDFQDTGHLGINQTDNHVDQLVDFFGTWLARWTAAAKSCRDSINAQQSNFATFIENVDSALAKGPNSAPDLPQWGGGGDPLLASTMSHDCDFDTALSNADSPPRPAVDTSLGVFAPLFGWLLRTESRDLTLIVGLLGFGLFGAISSSFIRQESESTTRNIFVRGIWAAILVYLAVVGGLAVFAQGSAVPNPYAIYFTCFVAAVFSEDVWSWAKSRQQEMFGASDLKKTPPS